MTRKTKWPRGAGVPESTKHAQSSRPPMRPQPGPPTPADWECARLDWEQEQRTRQFWIPYARSIEQARRGRPVSRADVDAITATLHRRLDNCACVLDRVLRRLRMEP